MDYNNIPSHLHSYIDRSFYENAPDNVKPYLVQSAELQFKSSQSDITRFSSYVPHDTVLYNHEEFPPHMNFVEHEYTIASDNPISRHTFIDYVRQEYHRLSNVKNITFRYDVSGGWCQWFSFSSLNIDKHGIDTLLDHMISGSNEWDEDFYGGSDYVRNYFHKRSLSYAQFRIVTELIQGGYGEVQYDYYKCIELTTNDSNDCLLECFRYFNDIELSNTEIRQLLDIPSDVMLSIEHMDQLENLFNINVAIYADRRTIDFRYKSGRHYYDHRAIIVRDYPVVLYGLLNTPYKILWKDNHFSVILDEYMARQCHCEYTGLFVGYGQSLSKEQIIQELYRQGRIDTDETTVEDEENVIVYYYFFDYETIYRANTLEIVPYAWALTKYTHDGRRIHTWSHVIDHGETLDSIVDILKKEAPSTNERKYLIGYNNSRFDNFFLINECQRKNIYVTNAFFTNNSILGMNIKGFIVRDLCRILCTTLDSACKGYKTDLMKGSLLHHEIQRKFMNQQPIDKKIVNDYVIRDCTSLSDLFFKCRKSFQLLIGANIEHFNTIAGMCYNTFKQTNPLTYAQYPIVDKTTNDLIRQTIYGGRSQIFRPCEQKDEPLVSIDCVSLYPYVMLHRRYPIGQPTSTSYYRSGKIGFYRCVIKKQPERNVIPKREETLNWTYRDEINCMLTSVDIECLQRHGGIVEIIAGYYWENDRSDIFSEFFSSIVEEKYRQDEWKGTDKYNAALRETCKLLMNSLSGKLQQRLFDTLIELIRNNDDLQSFRKKTKNSTETFTSIGKWYIGRGERLNVRPKMPTIWGSLILSYARSYMYDTILSRIDTIYGMDTDSAFIYKRSTPEHMIGHELGKFKEEIINEMEYGDEGPFGIFVAPKCYCFYKRTKDGEEIPIKMRFKGIDIYKDKVIEHPDIDIDMTIEELHDYYWNEKNHISIDTFRKLLSDKVYFLCSSLDKRLTDDILHKMCIKQRFAIKEVDKYDIDGRFSTF